MGPKQLKAGRPRSAENKANPPEQPLKPIQPKVPRVGELPKQVLGSHMGYLLNEVPTKASGPAIKGPTKLGPRLKKGPPL